MNVICIHHLSFCLPFSSSKFSTLLPIQLASLIIFLEMSSQLNVSWGTSWSNSSLLIAAPIYFIFSACAHEWASSIFSILATLLRLGNIYVWVYFQMRAAWHALQPTHSAFQVRGVLLLLRSAVRVVQYINCIPQLWLVR